MTLSRALSNAYSGLATASFRADIASNNVANANTPGYVRRTALLAENTVGGLGAGVRAIGVARSQDVALSAERRQAEASAGRADVISRAYTELNRALGEPDDATGLFASYQGFETAMRELSLTPESAALQNGLFTSTNQLVTQLNDLSSLGQRQRVEADTAIAKAVTTINSNLNEIEQINGDIAGLNEQSGEAAALEDRRQLLVDQISQFIPVKQIPGNQGTINLITNEGVFLLSGRVREISFSPAVSIPPGATYDDGAGSLSGLSVGNQNITPGSSSTFAGQSGLMAGFFSVRDASAPEFLDQIDALAADLISRFSDDALDPTKTPGDPGIFTDNGNALDPLNITGLASRLKINAAVDPAQGGLLSRFRDGLGATVEGPSGDASIIGNFLDAFTARQTAPAGSGLTGFLSSIESVAGVTSLVGDKRVRSDAVLSSAIARAEILSDAELAKTGVDTDQELQSLLLIEQAYAANARVVQTVSDMINRLLQI